MRFCLSRLPFPLSSAAVPMGPKAGGLLSLVLVLTSTLGVSCSPGGTLAKTHPLIPADGQTRPLVTDPETLLALGRQEDVTSTVEMLVTGVKDVGDLRRRAQALGISVSGETIVSLGGTASQLRDLEVGAWENPTTFLDTPGSLTLEAPAPLEPPDEKVYYLAGQDFGIPAYRLKHPEVDGRGTVIGVIDDGISLFPSGFQKTTQGDRKIKAFRAASPELNITLQDEDLVVPAPDRVPHPEVQRDRTFGRRSSRASESYAQVWTGEIREPSLAIPARAPGSPNAPTTRPIRFADWNENGVQDNYMVAVGRRRDGIFEVCVDLNGNRNEDAGECFGEFRQTGEFSSWSQTTESGRLRNLAGIFDPATGQLSLTEGESKGDSHGEGVASVAAGHNIGDRFDGLAPGAALLDYDLSTQSAADAVQTYSIGTFLRALEWMGAQGADVVNISYSLFFSSVSGQLFMQKALQDIIDRYNLVLTLSGGNNGPGLSSLNRRAIYPPDALVAGAFVGQALYEYVHGVTGLPKQGRVVSYSSRGPGPFGEMGPTVLSPLASLTHAAPGEGYRAFSGTSSASPALAGLASNLISKIRSMNLPVEAPLVVHALRMSGKPLEGVPFVEQGAGLPKLGSAVTIYKELLKAKRPVSVAVSIPSAPVPEITTAAAQGIMVRTSTLVQTAPPGAPLPSRSYAVRLRAILPASLPAAAATEALFPITVTSDADWVQTPARSFLSAGTSEITLTVDFAAAQKKFSPSVSELFASVTLKNEAGQTLWVIPVTVINDVTLEQPLTFEARLGTEQSERLHFYVPNGVQALRVRTQVTEGTEQNFSLGIVNPAGVVSFVRGRNKSFDGFVAVDRPGWHQLTLTKSRGGREMLSVSARVEPVRIKGSEQPGSGILSTGIGELTLLNADPSQTLQGQLELRLPPTLLKESLSQLGPGPFATFEVDLRGFEQSFALEVRSLGETDWSYFNGAGHSCLWELRDGNGTLLDQISGGNGTVLDLGTYADATEGMPPGEEPGSHVAHRVRKMSIRCTVFEFSDAGPRTTTHLRFRGRATFKRDPLLESWSRQGGAIGFALRPGTGNILIPGLLSDHIRTQAYTTLAVLMRGPDQDPSEAVNLGTVDVILN